MEDVFPMPDDSVLYRALESRDGRFDGYVFYGIRTTGIYCRPVCPARTPRIQNCRFFRSAAAAQEAGFRPCLRCRPETAPRSAVWHGTSNTVSRALALIEEGALDGESASVDALAERVGVGERQLRRLFQKHLGASPVAVAQTRRVLFAKQLLHDTRLPILDVAMAAGFGSERRFHEVFQQVFARPPLSIRRCATTDVTPKQDGVTLRIRYRPPYDWEAMLLWLRLHAKEGCDKVAADEYIRRVRLQGRKGTVRVRHEPQRQSLLVTVSGLPVRMYAVVLAHLRRLLDTDADIVRIEEYLACDEMLAPLLTKRPGLRVPGEWARDERASHRHSAVDGGCADLHELSCRLNSALLTRPAFLRRAERWKPWQPYAAQHMWLEEHERKMR